MPIPRSRELAQGGPQRNPTMADEIYLYGLHPVDRPRCFLLPDEQLQLDRILSGLHFWAELGRHNASWKLVEAGQLSQGRHYVELSRFAERGP